MEYPTARDCVEAYLGRRVDELPDEAQPAMEKAIAILSPYAGRGYSRFPPEAAALCAPWRVPYVGLG